MAGLMAASCFGQTVHEQEALALPYSVHLNQDFRWRTKLLSAC